MLKEIPNCCGFSLKHGTVIIGVVQSIIAFMFLILSAAYSDHPHELVDLNDPSVVPDLYTLRVILIVISVVSALQTVFSVLLVFGAETNRPNLLLPWLTLNPAALFCYLIATLVAIVNHTGYNTPFIFGHLLLACTVSVILVYEILTVHSLYKHLRRLNF